MICEPNYRHYHFGYRREQGNRPLHQHLFSASIKASIDFLNHSSEHTLRLKKIFGLSAILDQVDTMTDLTCPNDFRHSAYKLTGMKLPLPSRLDFRQGLLSVDTLLNFSKTGEVRF
jgi:hypothetical protein